MAAGVEVNQQQRAQWQLQLYTNRAHKVIVFSDRQYTLPLAFYAGYRLFERILLWSALFCRGFLLQ